MISTNQCISCVTLTKSLLNEILAEEGLSHNAVLVSPIGNIFVIGDTNDYEVFEVDKDHEQYIISDAGDVKRTILFHEDWSDYGLLISNNGPAISTTGISVGPEDEDKFKEFVKYETGLLGQLCEECKESEEEKVMH